MCISKLLGRIDFAIPSLCLNAAKVEKGDIFVALQGQKYHGIEFVDEAINNGCAAVLTEDKEWHGKVPSNRVNNLKTHLPALANYCYPNAKQKKIIAITGTNGKTSVASFISQLLNDLGKSNLLIGTLSGDITTPDIFALYKALDACEDEFVVLEVSSHALDQGRVLGLNFIQAIFTNLTQDHLDYHKNMADYLQTKRKLFDFSSLESVIINQDDKNHVHFLRKDAILYGINDFTSIHSKPFGFLLQLDNFVFETNLLGRFNLSNLLAALHSVNALGFDRIKIIPLLSKLIAPIGRMFKIEPHLVWIDYAHTPDALENAILTLKTHYPAHKVRVVFGCGGNRDKDKRAKMGKIASKLADSVILTDDNPRDETPQIIIDDILGGIDENYVLDIIRDRQLAIETAITTLQENECLLIAGKGHESTQICKNKTRYLNDIEIAQNVVI